MMHTNAGVSMSKSSLFQKAGIREGSWKSNHGSMSVINFSAIEKFEDKYAAYGCITVCTSNGTIGTLTHLDTTDINRIRAFVRILDTELKENKNTSKVILSGGSSLTDSQILSKEITQALNSNGYIIIGNYLDHTAKKPIPKIATLKQGKVLIKEFIKSELKDQITEISFIDGSKNVYLKEKELSGEKNQI